MDLLSQELVSTEGTKAKSSGIAVLVLGSVGVTLATIAAVAVPLLNTSSTDYKNEDEAKNAVQVGIFALVILLLAMIAMLVMAGYLGGKSESMGTGDIRRPEVSELYHTQSTVGISIAVVTLLMSCMVFGVVYNIAITNEADYSDSETGDQIISDYVTTSLVFSMFAIVFSLGAIVLSALTETRMSKIKTMASELSKKFSGPSSSTASATDATS